MFNLTFPMCSLLSPGQQQEGERGLNLLTSCGEAKAVRLTQFRDQEAGCTHLYWQGFCSLQGQQHLRKSSLASELQGQGWGMFIHLVYLWTLPWEDTEKEGSDSLQWATLVLSRLRLHYAVFRASIYKRPLLWRKTEWGGWLLWCL